ncbi:Extracellular ribonuclease precursor [Planctomycetes bacterium MalM25]|nr:Extracellular ribonuclease precursor [Planctomycetes bacterium MalM25]
MITLATRLRAFAHAIVLSAPLAAMAGPYDAPAGYYSTATGTGATLESQLASIMSTGHIQRTYGDFRNSAAITDRDPNNPNNILLVYDRSSVPATWDQGNTWNREHTWPQSRQPGSASNGTTGNLGDPHALRPSDPGVNSNRGNDPFGTASSSGSNGSVGSLYFPGDADKGDTARQLFYSATRYNGLSLVNGSPGSNQMGDLAALLNWHYSDAPDEFERRRNHTIYSQAENPSYYTNNRNAFIDHPEFVWSVFVDQANDTTVSVAGSTSIDLGRVYVGGAAPSDQTLTINKGGVDGTYYGVTTLGAATSDAGEYARPLAMGAGVSDSFDVGLDVSTAVSGVTGGAVLVDNLDVTTGGGAGSGANDTDDVIGLSFTVLDHPVASFAADSILSTTTIDFGSINLGSGLVEQALELFNYDGAGAPAFASDLDLDSLVPVGDSGALSLDLMTSSGLAQGDSLMFDAVFDTSLAGEFETTYTLNLSGEDLPGEQQQMVEITLLGEVVATLAGDYNLDGIVDSADYTVYRDSFGSTVDLAADGDNSGEIDAGDLTVWSDNYGATSAAFATAVPEPGGLLLVVTLLVGPASRRQR